MTPRSALTLVPASAQDGPVMGRLAREAYAPYVERIGREPAPMTTDYGAVAASGDCLLAWRDGVLVGMLVWARAEGALIVENVAVSPAAQGGGLGSTLLAAAEEIARSARLPRIELYTNEAMVENLAFYSRRGYTETHRAEQDGFRRVFFVKQLRV